MRHEKKTDHGGNRRDGRLDVWEEAIDISQPDRTGGFQQSEDSAAWSASALLTQILKTDTMILDDRLNYNSHVD